MADNLTLSSGQTISSSDPNYSTYAAQASGSPTGSIPADTLNTTPTHIDVTPPPPNLTPANSAVAGAGVASKSISDYIAANTAPPTPEQNQATALTQSISSLLGQDTGKATALQGQENTLGVPTMTSQLAQTQGDILTQTAAYNQANKEYTASEQALLGQGRGIPLTILRGQQAQIQYQAANDLNQKAAAIQLSQAQAQALQGNITAAKQTATDAVNLQYSGIEDQLKVQQGQLALLQPTLTAQEKIQAAALAQKYTQDQADIATKKAETQSVYNLMITPEGAAAKVVATDTPAQAAQKISTYLAHNPDFGAKLQVIGKNGTNDVYGFVSNNGTVTPYVAGGTQGNNALGLSVGTQSGLPVYNTQANNPGVARPIRDNNPGDIKATADSIKLPGVIGIDSSQATDGGSFLIFDSPASALKAAGTMLSTWKSYANMTAEQAIRQWSGGAYGAADLGLPQESSVKSFQSQLQSNPDLLNSVVQAIGQQEGFSNSSGTTGNWNLNDASKPDPATANVVDPALGRTPNAVWQNAIDYALTGKTLQSYVGGLSSSGTATVIKNAIDNKAAALADAAGVNLATLRQQFKANSGAINTQVNYLNNVQRALTGAEQGGQLTQQAFATAGVNPLDSTWANKTLNDLTKQFGSSGNIRAYQAAMVEIGNEYAQVFARGGQRNEQGTNLAMELTNGNVKLSDIQDVLNSLQMIGKNVVDTSIAQVKSISTGGGTDAVAQFLANIYGGSATSQTQAGGTTVLTWTDGKQYAVPNDKVNDALANGWKK